MADPTLRHWDRPDSLRPRDREVLALLSAGMTNREIAYALGLSYFTVRNTLYRCFQVLQVDSRLEAALWYRDQERQAA